MLDMGFREIGKISLILPSGEEVELPEGALLREASIYGDCDYGNDFPYDCTAEITVDACNVAIPVLWGTIQPARRHKRARVQKKWLKRYGFKVQYCERGETKQLYLPLKKGPIVLIHAANGLARHLPLDDGLMLPEFDNVRRCRICGCTDDHACPGGCWWVDEGLCSRCAGVTDFRKWGLR